MNDGQMEKLIAGIRENESKSQSLSETLMAFNDSFTRFMAQIEAVGQLQSFEESHEKITSLEEHIAGIKEDLELINTAQMVRINELGREIEGQMKNEFKEELKKELKEELLKSFEKIIDKKQAKLADTVRIGDIVYAIDEVHHAVTSKKDTDEKTIVYESKVLISGLGKAYNSKGEEQLLIYIESGEIHIL